MALGARVLVAVTRSRGALPLLPSKRDIFPSLSFKGYPAYIECTTSHLSSSYTARPSLHLSHPHHPYHWLKTLHQASWAPHSPTLPTRSLHSSTVWFHDAKPSGVQPPEGKETVSPPPYSAPEDDRGPQEDREEAAVVKQSLYRRVVDELKHYKHGFRLLAIDTRVSGATVWRLLQGETLMRQERRRLMRTCSDLLRLVPFVPFLVVPFTGFLLPVFIKLFPNMLPSTFVKESEKERKQVTAQAVKEKLAQFLQESIIKTAGRHGNGHTGTGEAGRFSALMQSARDKGEQPATGDIVAFSKHFEEVMTLERLERPQLLALCRLLEMLPIGTNNQLRWRLLAELASIKADDEVIVAEGGVATMDTVELQEACQHRGIRLLGLTAEQLREQLQQWLDMHLNENLPPSLMLLSRIMYLTELKPNVPVTPPVPKLKKAHPPPAAGSSSSSSSKEATDAAQKSKTNSNGV